MILILFYHLSLLSSLSLNLNTCQKTRHISSFFFILFLLAGLPGLGDYTGYTFSRCQVQGKGTSTCTTAAGGGENLLVGVAIDGIDSPTTSTVTISYGKPSIISLDPPVGPASGGFQVTITGENFGNPKINKPPACTVNVGGVPATIISRNDTHIVVTMPEVNGVDVAQNLVVITVAEQISLASKFYYYKMLDFSPHFGWWGGYTIITITGEGFVNIPGVDGMVEFENTGSSFFRTSVFQLCIHKIQTLTRYFFHFNFVSVKLFSFPRLPSLSLSLSSSRSVFLHVFSFS